MVSVNQSMQGTVQPVQPAQSSVQPVQTSPAAEPVPEVVSVGEERKPIWKKWWLWVLGILIIALVVIYLIT